MNPSKSCIVRCILFTHFADARNYYIAERVDSVRTLRRTMTTSSNMSEDEATNSPSEQPEENRSVNISSTKVFKKSAPNAKLTLYLGTRDVVISDQGAEKIQGVIYVEPDFLRDKMVFGQITLTFRYGREDEEVMGLKFCNEAVMCSTQLYPPLVQQPPLTPLQEALLKRIGPHAHPFTMDITRIAPPSVQLVPAKEYSGAPIGTSYDIRVFIGYRIDEKPHKRNQIRMGMRVLQKACMPPRSTNSSTPHPPSTENPPHAILSRHFLLSDGKVTLEARLDKAAYGHGDTVNTTVTILNESKKHIRRLKLFIIQHVDVCMFSNGKFKNVVATIDDRVDCPVQAGTPLHKTYQMNPAKGVTKNWIALEDSYVRSPSSLASTVVCNYSEERNVFAIYVSYYVKVELTIGAMNSKLSVKLPFTLLPSQPDTSDCVEQTPFERGSTSQSLLLDSNRVQTETIGIGAGAPSSNHDLITFTEYQGHPRLQPDLPTDL